MKKSYKELREVIDVVSFLSAPGAGLVAGIFFAFSSFMMKDLGSFAHQERTPGFRSESRDFMKHGS